MKEVVAILHNIRSIHNVASMFRTADGAGITKIYLTGITPGPLDRFDKPLQAFVKVSLGAEQTVPWERKKVLGLLLRSLKKDGYCIAALEQDERSIPHTKKIASKKIALIVGSEPDGLPASVLKQCEEIFEIPMRGSKESLNVSVAFGIAAYELVG